ncbi:MAG TPA: hypothetical protein VFA20_22950 [Myxococcaceae bacterium]|nr:hypothetical protein [Myxococcaceae bacterium]
MMSVCAGCAQTAASGTLLLDPGLRPGAVRLRRVAVVPGRGPAGVKDPERWRHAVWSSLERAFRGRGFDVVDYERSIQAYERAGLPLEEGRAARDRYGDLAQGLGVDLVAVAEFSTSQRTDAIAFIGTTHYTSLLTLQLYFAEKGQFGARIDASGDTTYTSGLMLAGGLLAGEVFAIISAAGCQIPAQCNPTFGLVGAVFLGLGTTADIGYGVALALPGADAYWEQSFDQAVQKGLEPFLESFAPVGGGSPAPPGTGP